MNYLYKFYPAKKKEILEVELDRSAKVKFLTALEFKAYKNGRTHSYYGGAFEAGTVRFVLPFDAVWYVVVEKGPSTAPLEVSAQCRLCHPDREALSTRPQGSVNGSVRDESASPEEAAVEETGDEQAG